MNGWERNNSGGESRRFDSAGDCGEASLHLRRMIDGTICYVGKMLCWRSINWMAWIGATFVWEVIQFALLADEIT